MIAAVLLIAYGSKQNDDNLGNSGEYTDTSGGNSDGSGSSNNGGTNGSGASNNGGTNGSGSGNNGGTNGSGSGSGSGTGTESGSGGSGSGSGSGTESGSDGSGSGNESGSDGSDSDTETETRTHTTTPNVHYVSETTSSGHVDNVVTPISGTSYTYATTTSVGYSAEYLGIVERNIPDEMENEGLSAYPTYGTTLSLTVDERKALIEENSYISAIGTQYTNGTYDKMDKDGYLYLKDGTKVLDSEGNQRKLYKHTASTSMYYGTGVADNEPGIIKRVTLTPRGYGSYSVTGVYAPAGEVIKIQISEADMKATGGITVYIGQVMYSSYPNNIGSGVNPNRMPILVNTMVVTKETATLEDGVYTAYVGSYLGGPIYIGNTSSTVTVTLSGGVMYSHFILGYTTKEEFEENAKSTAPYFDMEVRNYGVLQ
jgi:hypothetical protein